ncbi:MAG: hypothetical protein APR53_00225 [Methanoculleus sp. SDB]|nr:MAG: hypothetical protein APR53_00225 [Methanoculleus sp. SDB]
MNRILIALICGFIAAAVAVAPATAAYTIDGDLTDWGLAKLNTDPWSAEGTWLPNWHVAYIIEDNYNPNHNRLPDGVHIRGMGSNYVFYDEPKEILKNSGGTLVSEPYGGEGYDLEALYFDQDDDNIFIAIVTSLDPEVMAGDSRPGDLAMNLDLNPSSGDLGYEYGVKVTVGQGDIVMDPVWQKTGYLLPVRPDVIVSGTVVGTADVAFPKGLGAWLTAMDNSKPNYVIEMAIPKTAVGLATGDQVSFSSIMYADNCINEHIFVPEFPTIAISLGLMIGLIFTIFVVRKKE